MQHERKLPGEVIERLLSQRDSIIKENRTRQAMEQADRRKRTNPATVGDADDESQPVEDLPQAFRSMI